MRVRRQGWEGEGERVGSLLGTLAYIARVTIQHREENRIEKHK